MMMDDDKKIIEKNIFSSMNKISKSFFSMMKKYVLIIFSSAIAYDTLLTIPAQKSGRGGLSRVPYQENL